MSGEEGGFCKIGHFLRTSQMYDPNEVNGNKSVQNTKKKDCNVSEIKAFF